MFNNLKGRALTIGLSLACGAGFTLFGYDQGVFGGVLTNEAFKRTFHDPSATIQSQMVSTYYLGAAFGGLSSNYVGDKLGRRRAIMLGCIFLTIGGALQASAFGLPQMLVGRIIGGFGTGLNTTAIPLWQVETSTRSNRGLLVAFELVLVVAAQVIAALINFGFTYMSNTEVSWRFPLGMQCFFALITWAAVIPMPESPRWLLLQGRREEAHGIIARLLSKDVDDPEVHNMTQLFVDSIKHEQATQNAGIQEIFRNGPSQTLRRVLLGCGTAVMQQASGVNVVTNYLPIILTASIGMTEKLALVLTVVNSVNLTLWGILAMMLVDRVGRKTLMLYCAAGQSVCFFLVAVGVRYGGNVAPMGVTFIFVFGAFYSEGFLAIPWLYPAEINSQRMRNKGASISTTVNWLCVWIVTLVTPIGIQNVGWRFFLVFGCLNMAFLPVLWIWYVETANLTLEQIDMIFEIKYEGGSKMSMTRARRLAAEATGVEVDAIVSYATKVQPKNTANSHTEFASKET